MPSSLGPAEIMVILVVALIVLGPKRLPEAGRQVGKALSEVRRWSRDVQSEVKGAFDVGPAATTPPATPSAATPSAAPGNTEVASTTVSTPEIGPGADGPGPGEAVPGAGSGGHVAESVPDPAAGDDARP